MGDHIARRSPTLGRDWQTRTRTGQGEACKAIPSLPSRPQNRTLARETLMRINEWPKNLSPRAERRASVNGSVRFFVKANPNPNAGGFNGEVVSKG